MWWLTLPVIIYSAGLLVLWVMLVLRSDSAGPGDGGMTEAGDITGADDVRALPKISVVVAAKNEEKSLPALLESLSLQDYPPDLLEIIIVNDNSADRTPVLVSEFIESRRDPAVPGMKLIYNPFSGKKRAVRYGIEKASGEVIVTTDADCIVGPGWARSHAEWYCTGHSVQHGEAEGSRAGVTAAVHHLQYSHAGSDCPDMVLAPVVQRPVRGFWSYFGVFEFSALQALTEATVLAGRPVMCNAANMSFRRDVYMRHAGELRTDLPSGDDMFLLEAVMRDGGAVRHDGRRAAAAETAGAVTAAAVLRQRARWASKAFHLRGAPILILAAATAACNAAAAAAAVAAIISVKFLPVAATLYAIKTIPDCLLIAGEMRKRGNHLKTLPFITAEIIYPFYFMVVAAMSRFQSARQFRERLGFSFPPPKP